MQEIKATAVIPTMEYIMFAHGKDVYRDIILRLNPDEQLVFKKRMLPGTWVSTRSFMNFNDAAIDVIWKGDSKKAFNLGYESADRGFGTFYKLFMKLGNPNIIASKSSSLFESIHRPGKQTLLKNEKGIIQFEVSGFEEHYERMYSRMAGYYKRVCELTGAKNVDVSITNSNGDWTSVLFEVTYH